ncbi:MAG: hypothetical protein U0791_14970 [Gemmataceae bacterium]
MGIIIRDSSSRPDTIVIETILERPDEGRAVGGSVLEFEFEALVFAFHARSGWELGWSRITELVVRRSGEDRVCFRWRYGPSRKACGPAVEAAVEVIAAYLADRVFPDPFPDANGQS